MTFAPGRAKTAPRARAPVWSYEIVLRSGSELVIDATFASALHGAFEIDPGTASFVRHLRTLRGTSWVDVPVRESRWTLPCEAGCRVRYEFALREAALKISEADTAIAAGEVLIAPLSSWLVHPESPGPGARFTLSVDAGKGRFLTALRSAHGGTVSGLTDALSDASFAAFGPLSVVEIRSGGATITLGTAPDRLSFSDTEIVDWITKSAGAVADYYQGRLPARRALVLVMAGTDAATRGVTLGTGGPAILVRIGTEVTPRALREDWVLTHELLHVNFPDLPRQHAWLTEGLATYVEPLARARVGLLDVTQLWREWLEGMPQGLPEVGDQGLDATHTWGRTYWGGALFCLLADVMIRERTQGTRSLDDVLMAIGNSGGNVETFWTMDDVLEAAETATGTSAFRDLYVRMALKPEATDLSALFARLGVRREGDAIHFDDAAPLAEVRRALTAPQRNATPFSTSAATPAGPDPFPARSR